MELEGGNLVNFSNEKTIFEYMLCEEEKQRLDVLEIALLYDLPLLLWPFFIPPKMFNFDKNNSGSQIIIKYLNGFSYEGELINDKRSGLNSLIKTPKNKVYYQGNWQDDLPNGIGVIHFNKSYKYKGPMYLGKMHGKGGMIYCDDKEQKLFGTDWVRNKMKTRLDVCNKKISWELNHYYCWDLLIGLSKIKFQGPSEIFLFASDLNKTFQQIFQTFSAIKVII